MALSTLSPSKKVLPSAETARRKRSEPKSPTSALVTKARLERQPEVVARRLLVHRVEQIARAALGHGLRCPERGVQLGRERIGGIGGRAEPEQGEVLQRVRRPVPIQPDPSVDQQQGPRPSTHAPPARSRGGQAEPGAIGPERDVQVPARPVARRARGRQL